MAVLKEMTLIDWPYPAAGLSFDRSRSYVPVTAEMIEPHLLLERYNPEP